MSKTLLASALWLVMAASAAAQSQPVSGSGEAPITKDTASVRSSAEEQAKEDLVRNLARQSIGAERLGELTPDLIQRLAHQIRDDMIVDRTADRIGASYRVTLTARIDPAWFQARLDDEGVLASADRAGAERQLIFVMLEQVTGPARDSEKPAEIVVNYDHVKGSDYRDKSQAAYAEKDSAASSFRGDAAQRSSHSGAAAYDGYYGSAARRSSGASASATSVRAGSASSHSEAAMAKNDVAASEHDDVHYYTHIKYQTSATTASTAAGRRAVTAALQRYGVFMADSDLELASYFRGQAPTYSNLKASSAFAPFLTNLASRKVAPFFMGATLSIQDVGRDPATGQAQCSGQLDAGAVATSTSEDIASSAPAAHAMGLTYEECSAKLAQMLSAQAADELGPRIQSYWRRQLRRTSATVAAASGPSDYTVTIHGANLTMDMQADLVDALSSMPGVEKQAFLGQDGNQISFQVRYGGGVPLQLALYQKLRSRPGFGQMQPNTQGQSVDICLSACTR